MTVVLIRLQLPISNTINTLGTCRAANKHSAEHRAVVRSAQPYWEAFNNLFFLIFPPSLQRINAVMAVGQPG